MHEQQLRQQQQQAQQQQPQLQQQQQKREVADKQTIAKPRPVKQAQVKQTSAMQVPFHAQKAMPTSSGTSMFSRVRPAKHQRAEKASDTRQNQLYMAANARQPTEHVFDLQQPLIV